MSTPEGRVKAKVKRALAALPKEYHHMPVLRGMGAPALDFYCCIGGAFVAIETKTEGKLLTVRQQITKEQIEAAGGQVFVVDGDQSLEAMMAVFGMVRRGQAGWAMVG